MINSRKNIKKLNTKSVWKRSTHKKFAQKIIGRDNSIKLCYLLNMLKLTRTLFFIRLDPIQCLHIA